MVKYTRLEVQNKIRKQHKKEMSIIKYLNQIHNYHQFGDLFVVTNHTCIHCGSNMIFCPNTGNMGCCNECSDSMVYDLTEEEIEEIEIDVKW